VPDDHRSPGSDVVDVALAIGIPKMRSLSSFEEGRRAAHGAKRPHWGIHAGRDVPLRAVKEVFVARGHGLARACAANNRANARARAPRSGASKTAEITASASAPASSTPPAFSSVIPPIATRGTPSALASRKR